MKNKDFINKIILIITLFLGVAVVIVSTGLTYNSFVLKPQKEIALIQSETMKAGNSKQDKIDKCLADAKKTYERRVILNSDEAPTKDYPDARIWKNNEISLEVEKQYNQNREFCLKLYK